MNYVCAILNTVNCAYQKNKFSQNGQTYGFTLGRIDKTFMVPYQTLNTS